MDLFGLETAYSRLDRSRPDVLVFLHENIDWEAFRPRLTQLWHGSSKKAQLSVGRPPIDVVLMFKVLFLQSISRTSDRQTEYLCLDRLSWRRFLEIELTAPAPDAQTIYRYRKKGRKGRPDGDVDLRSLLAEVRASMRDQGYVLSRGRLVDSRTSRRPGKNLIQRTRQ